MASSKQKEAVLQAGEFSWKARNAELAVITLYHNSGLHPYVMSLILNKVIASLDSQSLEFQEKFIESTQKETKKEGEKNS